MEKYRLEPFWFKLLQKDDLRPLWHSELEVVFLLQGTARIDFPDLKSEYTLQERDIFVINCFEVLNFELNDGAAALCFSVSQAFINSVSPELLRYKVNCRSFLHMQDKQAAFDVLRRDLALAFHSVNKKESTGITYAKSSVTAILEDLSRYFLDHGQAMESRSVQETLKDVTNYIQQHYRERITLDDLVKHTFLSKTYLSRCFSRYLGISFTGYLELLRLSCAVRLMHGQGTLAQIAEQSGFPSVNAMIQTFKRYRGMTPGQYRANLNTDVISHPGKELQEEGSGLFASLLNYAAISSATQPEMERVQELTIDVTKKRGQLSSHWKRLLNVGYAGSLSNGTIQRELRYLQQQIGFEYLRIKGILDDDMCLLRLDMNGNPVVNFAYLDEAIDFILSLNAKPVLEMSFMPSLLAKNPALRSMRSCVVSGPKDITQWTELIGAIMSHLANRYGMQAVSTWLFSPWFPLDFIDVGLGSREEYAQVYAASCHAIRNVVPQALIVGPGSVAFCAIWPWYRDMCRSLDCMPDILSFRSYATAGDNEFHDIQLISNNESFPYAVSGDADYLAHTEAEIRNLLKQEGLDHMPLILEEWSNNIWQRDLCNDTCYKSAYLFKNILENNQALSAMGYFALNDRLDEVPPSQETFHGGFGLFTQDDIPKSACLAMELLAFLGDRLLEQGEGYLVSQRGEEIQIFLYNYSHYDLLYRYRHVANMDKTNREQVFVYRESRAFFIRLKNVCEGSYLILRYGITRCGGSSYDEWLRMGAPSPLNQEERERLRRLACPQYQNQVSQTSQGELHIKASLKPHDVCLIRVIKR